MQRSLDREVCNNCKCESPKGSLDCWVKKKMRSDCSEQFKPAFFPSGENIYSTIRVGLKAQNWEYIKHSNLISIRSTVVLGDPTPFFQLGTIYFGFFFLEVSSVA